MHENIVLEPERIGPFLYHEDMVKAAVPSIVPQVLSNIIVLSGASPMYMDLAIEYAGWLAPAAASNPLLPVRLKNSLA